MTDKPAIAAILATGRMEFHTAISDWRVADLGLRGEIIEAAQRLPNLGELCTALLEGRRILFRDDELDMTFRWSPE